MDTSTHQQWLPMPSGISLTHKSFANDLLEHFDIDRAGLGWSSSDEELDNIKPASVTQSITNTSIKEPGSLPHNTPSTSQKAPKHNNLLRKSSAYLFKRYENDDERPSLFHSLRRKKNFYHRPPHDSTASLPLSKVAVQTTIHIPHHRHSYHHTAVQPPIITHYPPKPLVYSPVEPLPEQEHSAKKILHRISLPLLRLAQKDDPPIMERRRSDSEVYKPSRQSSFSKGWSKLLFTCGFKKSLP